MKIAVVAHIRHRVAAPFMGGMEAHCHTLTNALRRRGHEVTLFAARGSCDEDLTAICEPYEEVLPWERWRGTDRLARYQREAFAGAWDSIARGAFDVVHNNSLFPGLIEWAGRDRIPMLTSQHVPPFGAMHDAVEDVGALDWLQFSVTSQSQLGLWSPAARRNMHVVYNGIDLAEWPVQKHRGNRLLWFGRITENKGLREAVEAASRAEVALDIAGSIEDRPYFDHWVMPYLGETIRYLGHLGGDALRQRVSRALACIVTPMWDEPFGLVAAEAMACGVPVIAFDRGAMREVLGACGALVPAGNVQALAKAMRLARTLDGAACREEIASRFSIDAMLDGYERCYAQAMAAAALPGSRADCPEAACASSSAKTEALLA